MTHGEHRAVGSLVDREGEIGLYGDGAGFTAAAGVLAYGTTPLPLSVLAGLVEDPSRGISAGQIVFRSGTRPYTWIALRLELETASAAIEMRGGGSVGMERALSSGLRKAIAEFGVAGIDVMALDRSQLASSLHLLDSGLRQNVIAIESPERTRLGDVVERAQADPNVETVDLVVTVTPGRDGAGFSAYVRLGATSRAGLDTASLALVRHGRLSGVGLRQVPLSDRE